MSGTIKIIIINPRNGLTKILDATGYNAQGIARTCTVYKGAGYLVKILENEL